MQDTRKLFSSNCSIVSDIETQPCLFSLRFFSSWLGAIEENSKSINLFMKWNPSSIWVQLQRDKPNYNYSLMLGKQTLKAFKPRLLDIVAYSLEMTCSLILYCILFWIFPILISIWLSNKMKNWNISLCIIDIYDYIFQR